MKGYFLLLSALLLASSPALADTTYTVNQTVGAGSVTGSITTDGNLGTLGSADILSWALTLNDGSLTFELRPTNSHEFLYGTDLTATASQLLYNYSASDQRFLLFEDTTDGGQFVCWASTNLCSGAPVGVSLATLQGEPDLVYTSLSGTGVIANAEEVTATPEPSSFLLLGTGLAGFAGALRRKSAR